MQLRVDSIDPRRVDGTSIHDWLPCHGRAMSSCACKRFEKKIPSFKHP
jgi:hypothetical protein